MKRTKSYRNVKRQPGSLKVWQEPSGYVWESVVVHHGRVTKTYRGPEAKHLNVAHEFLNLALKAGV